MTPLLPALSDTTPADPPARTALRFGDHELSYARARPRPPGRSRRRWPAGSAWPSTPRPTIAHRRRRHRRRCWRASPPSRSTRSWGSGSWATCSPTRRPRPCSPRPASSCPGALAELPRVDVDLAAAGPVPTDEPAPDAPALVVYTSGTTGPPKGAVLSRGAVASNLDALARGVGLDRGRPAGARAAAVPRARAGARRARAAAPRRHAAPPRGRSTRSALAAVGGRRWCSGCPRSTTGSPTSSTPIRTPPPPSGGPGCSCPDRRRSPPSTTPACAAHRARRP